MAGQVGDCQCRDYDQGVYPNCPVHGVRELAPDEKLPGFPPWFDPVLGDAE